MTRGQRQDEHLAQLMIVGAQTVNKAVKQVRKEAREPQHEMDNTAAEGLWLLARRREPLG